MPFFVFISLGLGIMFPWILLLAAIITAVYWIYKWNPIFAVLMIVVPVVIALFI